MYDLFPNPWLDIVCSAYNMPFLDHSISHLVLFDVFHHLERPIAFFKEARRVLVNNGRIIIFEPYISISSFAIYGLLHNEAVAWSETINFLEQQPDHNHYYAAQGNATRLFFKKEQAKWLEDWNIFHRQPIVSFSYIFSGGYSKPALYPEYILPVLQKIDTLLSRWPSLFASRCLIGLSPK